MKKPTAQAKKHNDKKSKLTKAKASSRPLPPLPTDPRGWISKRQVAALGSVNPWTVDQWRKDPTLGFPEPHWFGDQTARWTLGEILDWYEARPRGSVSPEWRARQAQGTAEPPARRRAARARA